MQKSLNKVLIIFVILSLILPMAAGCGQQEVSNQETRVVMDQLGRGVEIPENIERVAALHIFSAKIMYALGLEDKLVHKALYGPEGKALEKVSREFADLPELENHKIVNAEELLSLEPQVVFSYASFSQEDIEKFETAGLTVIAVKGETLEETYEAIRLMGEVFNCKESAEEYTSYIKDKLNLIKERVGDIPEDEKPKVLVTGPKSLYTVATGEMLQNMIIDIAGGRNVAQGLKGFWTEVSPEQIVEWNPDYIFMGSSFGSYTKEELYNNPAFKTINAVKNKKVYVFPSNIGWWDFPLPHAALGMLWSAKTLHPDKFKDLDVKEIADEYYERFLGYSFTDLGGKLDE